MAVESALAEVHVTLSSFYGQKTLLSLFSSHLLLLTPLTLADFLHYEWEETPP